jgi:hypothetical protein
MKKPNSFYDAKGTARKFIDKKEFNLEFYRSKNNKYWTNNFAIMMEQLITNIMTSNKFSFNQFHITGNPIGEEVKSRVLEKMIVQFIDKYDETKSDNIFAFASAMIYRWIIKYTHQVIRAGYNDDLYVITKPSNGTDEEERIYFVSLK